MVHWHILGIDGFEGEALLRKIHYAFYLYAVWWDEQVFKFFKEEMNAR